MARDFARKRKPAARRRKAPASKAATASSGNGWRWYLAGLASGLLLSLFLYLAALPPEQGGSTVASAPATPTPSADPTPPKPRYDFYTMLPEQTLEVDAEPPPDTPRGADPAAEAPRPSGETWLLQAGSFRQREDADRRRAELLLLGLDPRVEEASGENGRWFRVYLGPFDTRSKMSRARGLTAAQDIDTLLLKRGPR